MSLHGALAKLQRRGAELYLEASQFFSENNLIRETWVEMARDMEQQAESLKNLPGPFWTRLKTDEATLNAALELSSAPHTAKPWESKALRHCFARTLDFEEPLILRTYVPVIRLLRTEWTDHALDFYIIVKAHITRLTRTIEPLSGDPILTQRALNLMAEFEREVQLPSHPVLQTRPKIAARPKVSAREKQPHAAESASPIRPLSERSKGLGKHPKPLVKKLELPRRRARRS
jgi:hypothetical protein